MKLSHRLNVVASLVDMNTRVIDVGCDHAYLDIYLSMYNNNTCIAIDKIDIAVDNAKKNVSKYNLEKKIKVRLNDGLDNIKIKKTDNIVLSGLGAYTIVGILKNHELSDTLIISANNNIEYLRREVVKLGFYIDTEVFITDNNKKYVIIKFKRGYVKYKKTDYIVGPILRNNKEYKEYLLNKYYKILKRMTSLKLKIKIYLIILRIKRA